MKLNIFFILFTACSMHTYMHAEQLVVASQPVKATAFWYGYSSNTLGFTYECYMGELASGGGVATVIRCTDETICHQAYMATIFSLEDEQLMGRMPEGEDAQCLFEKLSACYREQYDPETYERSYMDCKTYQVVSFVPVHVSDAFQCMARERINIKSGLSGIITYMLTRSDDMQRYCREKKAIRININSLDMNAVIATQRVESSGILHTYVSRDRSTGALIVANAPAGCACKAEVIAIHERTEKLGCQWTYRGVYPTQHIANAEEVYTALEKCYKERYAHADHYNGLLAANVHYCW